MHFQWYYEIMHFQTGFTRGSHHIPASHSRWPAAAAASASSRGADEYDSYDGDDDDVGPYASRSLLSGQEPGAPDDDGAYGGWQEKAKRLLYTMYSMDTDPVDVDVPCLPGTRVCTDVYLQDTALTIAPGGAGR